MKPVAYAFNGAVVRVNVTVQFVVEPGAAVNDAADGVTVMPARPSTDARVRLRLRADARRCTLDGLRAGEVADRDRRQVQVAGVERIARRGRESLTLQEREPVVEVVVEDETRIDCLVRVDVPRTPGERTRSRSAGRPSS